MFQNWAHTHARPQQNFARSPTLLHPHWAVRNKVSTQSFRPQLRTHYGDQNIKIIGAQQLDLPGNVITIDGEMGLVFLIDGTVCLLQ